MPATARSFRFDPVQLVTRAAGIGAYAVGSITGAPYPTYLGTRATAERALFRGDWDEAASLATELLAMAERYEGDWYCGNAIHHGHLILGKVALARGETTRAGWELLAAGETPGSPQLNAYGPNLGLARSLLELGETDIVIRFLDRCKAFWTVSAGPAGSGSVVGSAALDRWIEEIRAGAIPDFGPNLGY